MSGYDIERPWLRQPFDTDVEWTWFQEYLGLMVPRKLVTLARREGCPFTWPDLHAVAEEYAWEARAQAWDDHLDQLRRDEIEKQVQETAAQVAQRHSRAWKSTFNLVAKELEKYADMSAAARGVPVFQPKDLFRGLDLAMKAERLLLGEVTQRTETQTDFSAWSTEDLAELRRLMAKNQGT